MPGSDDAWRIKSISRSCAISYACRYTWGSRAPLHSLCVPVEVAEQWLVGIEPGCGLEPGEAVVFADAPFADVYGGVVVAAEGHGVGYAGVAAGEPVFDVVDIAEHRRGGAAWGLASTVSGQDGSALGDGEQAFGTFLI